MNLDFLLKANQFRLSIGHFASAEDFVDVLNYLITPGILVFLASVSASKQYLFTPIQCWSIKETDSAQRMEYIENLCWVDNMYYWPLGDTLGKESEKQREQRTIYYYQWIPFVLVLQAVAFYLPRLCWLFLSGRSGTSVLDIMRFSLTAATVEQDKRQRLIAYLAEHIEKLMYHAQPYRHDRWSRMKRQCSQLLPCLVLTKRTGFALVGSYLLVKLMYLSVAVLQILLMERLLGFNSTDWGLHLLDSVLHRRTWQKTGVFPRVVRCDVLIDYLGSHNPYTVQCVLPNNMLNEKIYIFLWFWVWALAALSGFSCLSWALTSTLRSARRAFLKKYLRAGAQLHTDERSSAKRFVSSFLRHDGVFLLRMTARCAGDLVTAEIVREIWRRYRERRGAEPGAGCREPPDAPLLLQPPARPPRSTASAAASAAVTAASAAPPVGNRRRLVCGGGSLDGFGGDGDFEGVGDESGSYV